MANLNLQMRPKWMKKTLTANWITQKMNTSTKMWINKLLTATTKQLLGALCTSINIVTNLGHQILTMLNCGKDNRPALICTARAVQKLKALAKTIRAKSRRLTTKIMKVHIISSNNLKNKRLSVTTSEGLEHKKIYIYYK